jgi:hypothetical protein
MGTGQSVGQATTQETDNIHLDKTNKQANKQEN